MCGKCEKNIMSAICEGDVNAVRMYLAAGKGKPSLLSYAVEKCPSQSVNDMVQLLLLQKDPGLNNQPLDLLVCAVKRNLPTVVHALLQSGASRDKDAVLFFDDLSYSPFAKQKYKKVDAVYVAHKLRFADCVDIFAAAGWHRSTEDLYRAYTRNDTDTIGTLESNGWSLTCEERKKLRIHIIDACIKCSSDDDEVIAEFKRDIQTVQFSVVHSILNRRRRIHHYDDFLERSYRQCLTDELKAKLRERKLKISGNKTILIKRLCDYDTEKWKNNIESGVWSKLNIAKKIDIVKKILVKLRSRWGSNPEIDREEKILDFCLKAVSLT